ncbi:hypothetical protein B4U79_12610 [Dinothrombium tinctorium]|uniref:Small ribosomal subunit protein mS26 n=1 Tax=Dinothrombium tinctorium TaxID=1965070 RepID=A0A3S3PRP3_9ACAR|nr:hypothetical protein B4U79_01957 [Dinothrombium tinctorium]RWS06934.1 hypothetical protein B4U79_12610 [Dinothrombium tinctorium]
MNWFSKSTLRLSERCVQYLIAKRNRRPFPARKKIWQPTAPSKLFIIREKPVIPEDEQKQIDFLEERHEMFMKSIKTYFEREFYLPVITHKGFSEEQMKEEREEQRQLLLENEKENARVAALREEQMKLEMEMAKESLLEKQRELEREQQEEILAATELAAKEINRSETFITKANLEAAIENALLHPVHYEYAVDLHGNVIFEDYLHPYALKPTAVPETSSVTEEFETNDCRKPVKLTKKDLY